jgi:hypothetical protein
MAVAHTHDDFIMKKCSKIKNAQYGLNGILSLLLNPLWLINDCALNSHYESFDKHTSMRQTLSNSIDLWGFENIAFESFYISLQSLRTIHYEIWTTLERYNFLMLCFI